MADTITRRGFFSEVRHVTLKPQSKGAVRIFLIPPRRRLFSRAPSVVILNGTTILPLGYAWAVLLALFIDELTAFEDTTPESIAEAEFDMLIAATAGKCRRRYLTVKQTVLEEDLRQILSVITDVAAGREPSLPIGQMSLRQYAPHMTAPHRMDLMVSAMTRDGSWNCNQKCLHCYAAGQPAAEVTELSTEQWKNIIDLYRKLGIPQLTFTGGEPTMRADLVELIDHGRWFVTRLNTNGVLLTPELCRDLRAASLDSVQITLYSADETVHNRLVGAQNFDKTVAGLSNALAAGLDVSVNTPLCSVNADYLSTLAFLQEQGVRYVSCSGLILTGNAAAGPSADTRLTGEATAEILKRAAAYCAEHGMDLNFTSPGWVPPERLRAMKLAVPACGACLSNMATAPDGTVVPCQSWLSDGAGLGNALRDPWTDIWNHPAAKKIRGMNEEQACACPLKEVAVCAE